MKKINKIVLVAFGIAVIFCALSFKSTVITSTDLQGAWQYGTAENRTVMIAAGNVFSVANFNIPDKKFISSYGGTWHVDANKLIQKIEWNSKDPNEVGKEITLDVQLNGNKLLVSQKNESWDRVDNGTPGKLAGAWIITGNYTNDQVQKRGSPFFPRRTMKILSGTRFQWIAYNLETKKFDNTGGGSYTTVDGKYTENIEFFTKTSESVGKSLQFEYSFVHGDWRHKGQKSTGGTLDECWTKREALE